MIPITVSHLLVFERITSYDEGPSPQQISHRSVLTRIDVTGGQDNHPGYTWRKRLFAPS